MISQVFLLECLKNYANWQALYKKIINQINAVYIWLHFLSTSPKCNCWMFLSALVIQDQYDQICFAHITQSVKMSYFWNVCQISISSTTDSYLVLWIIQVQESQSVFLCLFTSNVNSETFNWICSLKILPNISFISQIFLWRTSFLFNVNLLKLMLIDDNSCSWKMFNG